MINEVKDWITPEKYIGEKDGNLYKAYMNLEYFNKNGFLENGFLSNISNELNISDVAAKIVEVEGYNPGNICYNFDVVGDYLVFCFAPIVVRRHKGELYELVTGLKVVPKQQGADEESIAVDKIVSLGKDELSQFMDVMANADDKYDIRLYSNLIYSLHAYQLNQIKKYSRN